MASKQAAAQGGTPPVGSLFGLPGLTNWTEQKDNNDQSVVTLNSGAIAPAAQLVEFKQTDIVFWWEMELSVTNGIGGLGAANTVATSPYFPYNFLGDSKLQIQNMYPAWHVISGIDAYLFQSYRPMRGDEHWVSDLGTNVFNAGAGNTAPNNLQPALDGEEDTGSGNFNVPVQLTPAAVAANTTAEQTFAVTGFGIDPKKQVVIGVSKPSAQAGLGIVGARVSAANQLAITFSNNTAAPITPTAAEVYTFALSPVGDPATNGANSVNGQAGPSSVTFTLELPVSLMFDVYIDIAKDGTIVSQPHRAIVSPIYMAGSARVIQPQIQFNPGLAGNLDLGPYFTTAGAPTFTASSVTLGFRRSGIYSSNRPELLPIVYNWQYMRDCKQYSLSGRSSADILVPTYGQILSLFLRFFDPAVANGGAPIDLSALTKAQLQFGSSLLRFDDTPRSAQRRFVRQHGFLPPKGVLIWDLATDFYGRVTNAMALNTLTTAGVNVHLEFTGAQSSSAYLVMGIEALTYVE